MHIKLEIPKLNIFNSDIASATTSITSTTHQVPGLTGNVDLTPIYKERIDRYGTDKQNFTNSKKTNYSRGMSRVEVEECAINKFRKNVSNILIPLPSTLYDKTIHQKKDVKNIEGISLSIDLWTARVNDVYIATRWYYITKDLDLKTFLLKYEFQDMHSNTNIQELHFPKRPTNGILQIK